MTMPYQNGERFGSMIPPDELLIEPYSRHPPGGQHVGVTVGVRVEHLPTGLIAICQSNRSQHRNKGVAIRMIEAALTDPEFRP